MFSLGVVLFPDNIIVTAVWKSLADQSREPRTIAYAQRLVTVTDWIFTLSGVVLILVGRVVSPAKLLRLIDFILPAATALGLFPGVGRAAAGHRQGHRKRKQIYHGIADHTLQRVRAKQHEDKLANLAEYGSKPPGDIAAQPQPALEQRGNDCFAGTDDDHETHGCVSFFSEPGRRPTLNPALYDHVEWRFVKSTRRN